MKPRLPAHWQTIPAFPTASLILLFRFSHLMMISVGLKVTQPLTNFELSNRMVYFPPNMSVFSFHHLLTFPTLSTKYTFIEMSQYSLDVTGDLVWCRQGSTIGQMGLMMATDDVGCTAKSITTCNNLSWSSVSLCQGEEEPREVYHDRAASYIESSLCLGHMAHSLRSSCSRHLPGSTMFLCCSQSFSLWCPLCWQLETSLSLDCHFHVTLESRRKARIPRVQRSVID